MKKKTKLKKNPIFLSCLDLASQQRIDKLINHPKSMLISSNKVTVEDALCCYCKILLYHPRVLNCGHGKILQYDCIEEMLNFLVVCEGVHCIT